MTEEICDERGQENKGQENQQPAPTGNASVCVCACVIMYSSGYVHMTHELFSVQVDSI